jgi:glycosyltransferase involved in cell wall biosynthesis
MKSLSLFFPALNEEKNIAETIRKSESYLQTKNIDYEIIVVNNASTDNTEKVVKRIAATNPHVILVNEPAKGYGNALRKGFAASTKEVTCFTDADLQFDITQLDRFIEVIDTHDYVIGYRERRADPALRSFNAKGWAFLVRSILGVRVKDIDCGFKMFHTKVIKSITLTSSGALISAELLYKLKKKKYTLTQVPVTHYPRKFGSPTGANFAVIARAFVELFKLKFNVVQ